MKALKYGFGLILVGGFALTASCGGSSDDSSSASAGTSATTGGTSTGTGGTFTGTGGTFTGTGGTNTASGGTGTGTGGTSTATGGTGTGGTRPGTGGTGGAAQNPATCPPATPTPMSGDTCTVPPPMTPACVYGNTTCTCRANRFGGQAGAPTAGDGTLRCVATPPPCVEGGMCTRGCALPNFTGFCQCQNNVLHCTTFGGAAGAGGAG